MTDDLTPDDLLIPGEADLEDDAEKDPEIDDLPPPNMSEDGEDLDDDEAIIGEEFSPVEAEAEFDPEDPDAYLYSAPGVKYSDSAEENEADWLNEEEF